MVFFGVGFGSLEAMFLETILCHCGRSLETGFSYGIIISEVSVCDWGENSGD